ncbi:hypothetical protein MRX96_043291 [Rhipicephalus microplus]
MQHRKRKSETHEVDAIPPISERAVKDLREKTAIFKASGETAERKGYEVIVTRASDMRWLVEVSPAEAEHGQLAKGVTVDSVEVLEEAGKE